MFLLQKYEKASNFCDFSAGTNGDGHRCVKIDNFQNPRHRHRLRSQNLRIFVTVTGDGDGHRLFVWEILPLRRFPRHRHRQFENFFVTVTAQINGDGGYMTVTRHRWSLSEARNLG